MASMYLGVKFELIVSSPTTPSGDVIFSAKGGHHFAINYLCVIVVLKERTNLSFISKENSLEVSISPTTSFVSCFKF